MCAAGLLSLCGVHMKTPLAHKGFTHGKINRPVIELCCSGSPGERLICAPVRPLSKPQIMVRGQRPLSLSRKHTHHSSNNYRTTWVNNALNRLCSEHGEAFLDMAGLKQNRPWFTLNYWNVYKMPIVDMPICPAIFILKTNMSEWAITLLHCDLQ